MNINTKISLLVAAALVLTAASVGTLAMWQINRTGVLAVAKIEQEGRENIARIKEDGQRQTHAFREQLIVEKKEYLKSQVQTTVSVLEKAYKDASDPARLGQLYEAQLQNAVNTAYSILESVDRETELTLFERQAKAAGLIRALRYGPDNKDYFWINDMQPRMVMHPYKPELEGQDIADHKDPDGRRLFMEMVGVSREKGQGFVNYSWPKYGSDQPQPKLSFVKLYRPWNWVIGSGLYLEMAEEKLKADAAATIQALRYGPEGKDYFWINDMQPRMVMHPYTPELQGKDLSENKDPDGKRLFMEMVKVCREQGEGFVDYSWPKYGSDKPQPKLSFVKLFKEWNWVIGTGVYIDDIDTMVAARSLELEENAKKAMAETQARIAATKTEVQAMVKRVLSVIGGITVLVLAVVLLICHFFMRFSITRPVRRIIDLLQKGADQVSSASGQVAEASQSLAEGASEHAASIEETSSSLEEIASMTRQNADNARQADQLMKAANQVVEKANESMAQLIGSMKEIARSSEATSKIVKTIDEIAFQTNLLALNAAVEAARAGEAGAGFAVVADEVRNLAMRAAEAAKNTAELIEGTVRKVQDGSSLVARTDQDFSRVAESAVKVGDLVAEIAAASSEQAQAIEHVNVAAAEMDKVVQQNAANAEESAGASEEMNGMAEQMKRIVGELSVLVDGAAAANRGNLAAREDGANRALYHPRPSAHAGTGRIGISHTAKRKKPEEVIPLDSEFTDF